MNVRHLYHGTTGDNIIRIIKDGRMKPDRQNEIYFCDVEYERRSLYAHGGDVRRKAAFVIKVEINVPHHVKHHRKPTPGVTNTLVLVTADPLPVKVLELYVRRPGDGRFVEEEPLRGVVAIVNYLNNRR